MQEETKREDSGPLGGLFGRAKKAAAEEPEQEEEPQLQRASPFAGLLGGTRKVSARAEKAAAQPAKQAKRAAAAVSSDGRKAAAAAKSAAPETKPSGGLFGRGKAAAAQGKSSSVPCICIQEVHC